MGSHAVSNPVPNLLQPLLVPSWVVISLLQPLLVRSLPASRVQIHSSQFGLLASRPAPHLLQPLAVPSRLVINVLQPAFGSWPSRQPAPNILQPIWASTPPAMQLQVHYGQLWFPAGWYAICFSRFCFPASQPLAPNLLQTYFRHFRFPASWWSIHPVCRPASSKLNLTTLGLQPMSNPAEKLSINFRF